MAISEKSSLAALVLFTSVAATSSLAHAVDYQYCASASATFDDNGFGEDEWNVDSVRAVESAYFEFAVDSSGACDGVGSVTIWQGFLDATGCAPVRATNNTTCHLLSLWSDGNPGGNSVYAFDEDGIEHIDQIILNPVDTGGQRLLTYAETDYRRFYMTVAHVINARFRGRLTGTAIDLIATTEDPHCDCSGEANRSCQISSNYFQICLEGEALRQKFAMAHEYGHANFYMSTSNSIPAPADYSLSGSGHHYGTREYMTAAMIEGWAHFVGVDAWNDDDDGANPDGYFWAPIAGSQCRKPTTPHVTDTDTCPASPESNVINAESTGCYDECVIKFMEAYWSSSDWPGRGNETDWMRLLWDYHTNSPGKHGTVPSHTRMQDEVGASGTLNNTNAYDRYRLGVAANSGCNQYQRFVYYAAANGVDHCDGSCDDVPSCSDCDASGCP